MFPLGILAALSVPDVAELQGTFRPRNADALDALTLKTHCTVDLTWIAPGTITVKDSGGCGGHDVTFDGTYRRAY